MKLSITAGATAIAAAFTFPISATAESQSCTSSSVCISAMTQSHSVADYEVFNVELVAILASLRSEIVGTDRDDDEVTDLLQRGTQLCELAKCKAQKSVCGEIFQIQGLHQYLQQDYVPALVSLNDMRFSSGTTAVQLLN